jgi:Transposase DDE domain
METKRRKAERKVGREELDELMGEVFGGEIHAQRVASLSDGVDGVLHAASLGVRAIGHGLAVANGLAPRHAIKQVDRLLSNPKLIREEVARCWVRFVVAERQELFVNFDWTEFEDSDQSMIVLGTQTEHGRSTPLVWKTVTHSELKDQRHAHEDELLGRLTAVLPKGVRVTVVADRGFSDIKLYRFLKKLGFEYVIRFRRVVYVASADGERRKAKDWLGAGGRMRVLRGARVTAEGQPVPMVVCVQQKQMQEPWLLASSRSDLTGTAIKHLYGKRFTVEETFRDVKNPRLGLGLKQTVMERNDRRDALFLLAVLAHTLLTRLGKAGEELGMDRWLGATRPQQYSRFRQGQMLFDLIPTMERKRLRTLLQRFGQLLREHVLLSQVLGYL